LLLLNRRSTLEPFAGPAAPAPLTLAFALGAGPDADPPLLAAAELAGRAGLAAAFALLLEVPLLVAALAPVLEVPLLAVAAELPDAACTADAPTVALPTTGSLRNRKCCCPSVHTLVVTQ
jgi:hypothetical protein